MNKIYFDLDGVLANFEKAVVETVKIHYWDRKTDKYWHILDKVPGLYAGLELLPSSLAMFNLVLDKHGPGVVEVLTGLPKPTGFLSTAANDKKNWVHAMVNANVQTNVTNGGRYKYKYLEENPGALLIDDYDRNIKLWIEHGGIGILHTDPASTIEKLKLLKLL